MHELVERVLPRAGLLGTISLAAVIVFVMSHGVAAAVPGAKARQITYAGTTSQHAGQYGVQQLPTNQVSFTLANGAVRKFSIPWVAACMSPTNSSTDALLERTLIIDALPVRRGRFAATASYNFSPGPHQTANVQRLRVTGRFSGRRASGTLSITAPITQANAGGIADCYTSHPIRWRAVAGGSQRSLAYPALLRPQQLGFIAYARTEPTTGTAAIWLSNRTGGAAVQVTQPPPGVSDTSPSLSLTSANGPSVLVYERTVAGVSQIYITDPFYKPSNLKTRFPGGRLTDFPTGAGGPAISERAPGRIVFSVGSGADCSLWVMDQSGAAQRRLTDHGGRPGCDSAPAWSPDGKSIAFHRELTDPAGVAMGGMDLVVAAAGGTPRTLTFPSPVTAFSWAPARKLVFLAPGGTGTPCLQTMNPDGSAPRTILCAAGLTGRPVWAPSGDAIAFVQSRPDGSTEIATVSASGGAPVALTNTPGISEDAPGWTDPPNFGLGGGQPGPGVHARPQRPGR